MMLGLTHLHDTERIPVENRKYFIPAPLRRSRWNLTMSSGWENSNDRATS